MPARIGVRMSVSTTSAVVTTSNASCAVAAVVTSAP
jgi:hypothetical protein